MWKWFRRLSSVSLVVVAAAVSGFVIWANNPLAPMPEALAALESDSAVEVKPEKNWVVFSPVDASPTTGFIFYPGGHVDANAYAPQLRKIAENGYLTILVSMPFNLAVFGIEDATPVIEGFPNIEHWAIGGHSLGGAMAARYVQSNPTAIDGLVFWASYPDIDLSDFELSAVSIYGTNDAVAQSSMVLEAVDRLPSETAFVAIEGGNHSQFGWYGLQPGDNTATISYENQQEQIVNATVELLANLEQSAN